MAVKNSQEWYGCPIRFGATVFGDNWTMLVLRDLMFKGARYYADFLNAGEGISTNILASRLLRLENEKVILKHPDPEHGSRYIYTLDEKGYQLIPIMLSIIDWSHTWDQSTEVPEDFIRSYRENKTVFTNKLIAELRESADKTIT